MHNMTFGPKVKLCTLCNFFVNRTRLGRELLNFLIAPRTRWVKKYAILFLS